MDTSQPEMGPVGMVERLDPTMQEKNREEPVSFRLLLRRLLIILALLLATFFVAESGARLLVVVGRPPASHARHFDLKHKLAIAPPEPGYREILLLGDSKMNFALYPSLLRMRLRQTQKWPVTVRNLAGHSNTPKMNLFLLQSAVQAGHRPALVVFNLEPWFFMPSAMVRPFMFGEEATFRRSYMAQCMGAEPPASWRGQLSCQIRRHSYFVRNLPHLKSALVDLNRQFAHPESLDPLKGTMVNYLQDEVTTEGWAPGFSFFMDEPMLLSVFMDYQASNLPFWATPDYQQHPVAWAGNPDVAALQAYCQQQGIPLALVWLPELLPDTAYPGEAFYGEHYRQTAREAGHIFLDLHRLPLEPADYHDGRHVNVQGAIKVTNALARELPGVWQPEGRR